MTFYKWSKTAGNNSAADSTINWAEGMAPSAVNDSGRAEMAANAKGRDDVNGSLTTAGTATAFTLATNQVFDTLAHMDGMMIAFRPHATSGAAPTLNVDSLGAKAINLSTGVAVPTGALVLGTPYVVTYIHASTEFILQGMIGAASFGDPTQIKSTDAGAGVGPILDLFRDSASPAVNDVIGAVDFNGRDSGAAKQNYARIAALIISPTGAAESGILIFQQVIAGAFTTILQSSATAWNTVLTMALTNATNALALAGGTTGQRSGSPTAGDTRYNTTLNGLEYWNGTAWIVLGQAPTVFTFTSGSAATYTPTAGTVRIRVRMSGGGAGGGAAVTNNGIAGNESIFENWHAAGGGVGLAGAAGTGKLGGAGGTGGADGAGTKIVRLNGGAGDSTTGIANFSSGHGGGNPFGGGAAAQGSGAAGLNAATNTGGGGSGGSNGASGIGSSGGAGEYVEFWMTAAQVGASKTYTVGAAANGGAAGTFAGGNGAAGIIIIEEFYS